MVPTPLKSPGKFRIFKVKFLLVLDSPADWKPVKMTKQQRDVVKLFCSRHDPSSCNLDSL